LNRRLSLGSAFVAIGVASVARAASAQNGTENYYYPPKIAAFGKSSIPVAGAGKVVVKVFVKADGTFAVSGILKSTNHGDDATALDIAKHSTYHPASRGIAKKPTAAYYDFAINFTGSGSTSDASEPAAGGLSAAETALRAGKYTEAQTALNAYLTAHPGDQKATLDLAIALVFLQDDTGAAATFDKVTTVPEGDKAVAVKAYAQASAAAIKAGKNADAVGYAKRAVTLAPGPTTYNTLGTSEFANGDNASAVADLQKAHDGAGSLSTADRVNIDLNLINVLYAAGNDDQAKPVVAEVNSLAPGNATLQTITAIRYEKAAKAADAANDYATAEAAWEQAAIAAPSQAAPLYGRAALDELQKKTGSDPVKARAYADKALAVDPNSAIANYVVGYVLAKQGKKTDALAYLTKADAESKTGTDGTLTSGIESLIKQVNGS
jgi:tetratricopeptide (TPR) repeat protein